MNEDKERKMDHKHRNSLNNIFEEIDQYLTNTEHLIVNLQQLNDKG